MRRLLVALATTLVGGAVLAPPASAALTAREIRIGDHPGFVRVVVDFTGGRVETGEVVATDPDPFPDGFVRLPLTRAGVRTTADPVRDEGVFARIAQGSRQDHHPADGRRPALQVRRLLRAAHARAAGARPLQGAAAERRRRDPARARRLPAARPTTP